MPEYVWTELDALNAAKRRPDPYPADADGRWRDFQNRGVTPYGLLPEGVPGCASLRAGEALALDLSKSVMPSAVRRFDQLEWDVLPIEARGVTSLGELCDRMLALSKDDGYGDKDLYAGLYGGWEDPATKRAFVLRIFEFLGNSTHRFAVTKAAGFSWSLMETPERIVVSGGGLWQVLTRRRTEKRSRVVAAAPHSTTTVVIGEPRVLVIIGSPAPNEQHPMQFVDAARVREPHGRDTLWLVEESGYRAFSSKDHSSESEDLRDKVEAEATKSGVMLTWLDRAPHAAVVNSINMQDASSIKRLAVYSHGLVGLVALRHGHSDPDVGFDFTNVDALDPTRFVPGADVELNSCNSGTDPDPAPPPPGILSTSSRSLAQAIATRLGTSVKGWTGRISFRDTNSGGTSIVPSEVVPGHWYHPDGTEVMSRAIGRTPRLVTFTP